MSRSFERSGALLERALRSIPLASQTFSKSVTHLPKGVAPLFLERGKGSAVWDVDGNRYIDYVNALAAVTLGYADADVDAAVREQLKSGVTFSLSHKIECEVAEALIELIPCAEKVRFGKNGSDATSAAIRVARAHTGRDRVAVCGYHGWQDWFIGTTSRNLGVPKATRELSHPFSYNDLGSLERLFAGYPDQFAAVILEPMSSVYPRGGFLEGVRDLTHRAGALLVFDETLTGFRFALGGAQALFDVTPDLATFGKGVANGFPLSIVVGSSEVMRWMEEIFFSTTFGGETLSLAAARAVITKMRKEPVIETMAARGQRLKSGFGQLLEKHRAHDLMSIAGHPALSYLGFADREPYTSWEIKTYFLQEVFERGVLTVGGHNLSYAHTEEDIETTLGVYDDVIGQLVECVSKRKLREQLRCEPLEPLFRVREAQHPRQISGEEES